MLATLSREMPLFEFRFGKNFGSTVEHKLRADF